MTLATNDPALRWVEGLLACDQPGHLMHVLASNLQACRFRFNCDTGVCVALDGQGKVVATMQQKNGTDYALLAEGVAA